jgi:hypothetical protein
VPGARSDASPRVTVPHLLWRGGEGRKTFPLAREQAGLPCSTYATARKTSGFGLYIERYYANVP